MMSSMRGAGGMFKGLKSIDFFCKVGTYLIHVSYFYFSGVNLSLKKLNFVSINLSEVQIEIKNNLPESVTISKIKS